jgi:chitodextrinase
VLRKRILATLGTLVMTGVLAIALPTSSAFAAACVGPVWNATGIYVGGTQVNFNGVQYTANWWSQGHQPDQFSGQFQEWTNNGACTGGGGGTAPPPPPPPPSSGGFVVTEAQFNQMFPSRNPFYTYAGLTTAMNSFPAFATTGSDTVRRQEAAAWLANANHETGGLVFITEINKGNDLCDETQSYGCPAGTFGYYGRGPIQLSWNFNYKAAGDALGMNLLVDPFRVERESSVAWATGLWYWMTQNGPGTMTAHNAMVTGAGFGETIRSINGALECNGGNPAQVQSRVAAYQRFTQILGVAPGNNVSC